MSRTRLTTRATLTKPVFADTGLEKFKGGCFAALLPLDTFANLQSTVTGSVSSSATRSSSSNEGEKAGTRRRRLRIALTRPPLPSETGPGVAALGGAVGGGGGGGKRVELLVPWVVSELRLESCDWML
ncbi:hypothetical protein KC361_g250 [Hortaea werneckii]|nr:hypothetical protein KC361_g250 [Hortaea werneckii]